MEENFVYNINLKRTPTTRIEHQLLIFANWLHEFVRKNSNWHMYFTFNTSSIQINTCVVIIETKTYKNIMGNIRIIAKIKFLGRLMTMCSRECFVADLFVLHLQYKFERINIPNKYTDHLRMKRMFSFFDNTFSLFAFLIQNN